MSSSSDSSCRSWMTMKFSVCAFDAVPAWVPTSMSCSMISLGTGFSLNALVDLLDRRKALMASGAMSTCGRSSNLSAGSSPWTTAPAGQRATQWPQPVQWSGYLTCAVRLPSGTGTHQKDAGRALVEQNPHPVHFVPSTSIIRQSPRAWVRKAVIPPLR